MNRNNRTAGLIVAAAAFFLALFVGALTAPFAIASVSGLFAAAARGEVAAIPVLALGLAVLTAAATFAGQTWARLVLAVAAGLALGSLAPPMSGAMP